MKKPIAILIAAIVLAALIPKDLDAGIGIKGGYTLSRFMNSPSPLPPQSNLPYFAGGLFFNLGIGFFSFQPEILYVRMGNRFDADPNFILENWLDYIQVPVLLKINVVPAGPVRPFLCAGGYGAYLFKATGVTIEAGVETSRTDLGDTYLDFDYGVIGGVGLTFKLPGLSITVEGRYNYGLRDIDTFEGEFMRNSSLMAFVGIGF